MHISHLWLMPLCLFPLLALGQDATPGPALAPREMFYAARDEKPKARTAPKPKPAAQAAVSENRSTPVATSTTMTPDGQAQIIRASDVTTALGLRYTLVRRSGNQSTDVSPDAEFHSGDRIQVGVEVTDAGYLYVVSQGTSGTWEILFPEAGGADNRVESGQTYLIPHGRVFSFVGQPGVEKLFVVFARQKESDLENLVFSLQGGQKTPAAEPLSQRPPQATMEASLRPLDNSIIERMRAAYSRDLVIEKVDDEEAPGKKQDKSVYVVNPKAGSNARVVADIRLNHQ